MKDAMSGRIGAIAPGAEDPRVAVTKGDALDDSRPQFPYSDLRGWIVFAAEEILQHSDTAPCVIFDDVPGCPKGFLNRLELREAFLNTYLAELKQLPYREVSDGPIFENILMGDDVDVTKFPVPVWHERDGGRYIGTGSFNVTRDPEEGWINCGTYRVMIQGKRTVGFYISEDRAAGDCTNSRAIIDGCRPFHWRDKFPPVNMPSPEAMKKAREKFSYLLE